MGPFYPNSPSSHSLTDPYFNRENLFRQREMYYEMEISRLKAELSAKSAIQHMTMIPIPDLIKETKVEENNIILLCQKK